MPTVRVGDRHQVRLPAEAVRALRVRKGSKLDVRVDGEQVVLAPAGRAAKAPTSPWTDAEWQAREAEADADTAAGRVKQFSDVEELIRELRGA